MRLAGGKIETPHVHVLYTSAPKFLPLMEISSNDVCRFRQFSQVVLYVRVLLMASYFVQY